MTSAIPKHFRINSQRWVNMQLQSANNNVTICNDLIGYTHFSWICLKIENLHKNGKYKRTMYVIHELLGLK